jgi:anti-sigma regulatory factor (Ser/Thr protein kinase)
VYRSPDGGSAEAVVGVTDASGVAAARRRAAALTRDAGFDETAAGRAAIVVTEAATNVLKHGAGGEVLLQGVSAASIAGLEVLALDRGPGIPSLVKALRDGYSTAGSAGTGLGSITRQADVYDVYSLPGRGTAILAQIWAAPVSTDSPEHVHVGAVCVPAFGEEVSGDGWLTIRRQGLVMILLVDGLGHGPGAAEARREATRIFHDSRSSEPGELIEAIHAGLRGTRGAAVAVSAIDPERGCLRFCGLGNIAAVVIGGPQPRHLLSHSGTAGHAARKIETVTYPWPVNAILVQSTDGLTTHWTLEGYPGLSGRHPSLVAGVLYRDFKRGRDDVAVVVAQGVGR